MKVVTMRGHELDMSALIAKNANKVAVGNASMNARGDIVHKGRVVKQREQIAMEYHESKQAVRSVGIKNLAKEMLSTPAEAVAADKAAKAEDLAKKRKLVDPDGGA